MAVLIFTSCNADACFYQSRCAGKVFCHFCRISTLKLPIQGTAVMGRTAFLLWLWQSKPHVS